MVFYGELCGIIGWFINLISYHKNNLNKLLIMQITGSIFFCLGYLLLGADSGLFICFFELVKMYAHYKYDNDRLIFLSSLPVYALIAYFTCHTPLDYLPVIASVIDSYTISKNMKVAVFGGFLSYSLWVVYDVAVIAYASALTDLFIVISNGSILLNQLIGLFTSKKIRLDDDKEVDHRTLDRIVEIDIENFGNRFIWPIIYQHNVYLKNKESFLFVTEGVKIVGYLNYLVINEEEFENIISKNEISLKNKIKNVSKFSKKKINYIQIEGISVEKKYQNKIVMNKLIRKFNKIIRNKMKKGYEIGGIVSIAITDFERDLLKELDFEKIHSYSKNETLHLLDFNNINEKIK